MVPFFDKAIPAEFPAGSDLKSRQVYAVVPNGDLMQGDFSIFSGTPPSRWIPGSGPGLDGTWASVTAAVYYPPITQFQTLGGMTLYTG